MTGVEFTTTTDGTTVEVDGESIGTFPTKVDAQRSLHRFLQGLPVLAASIEDTVHGFYTDGVRR